MRARIEVWLHRLWFGPRSGTTWLLERVLTPLSWLVGRVGARRRDRLSRARTQPRGDRPPVVVIGNFLVGGTGKTPLVISLALSLAQRGWRPGLLVRGYRRTHERTAARRVVPADRADDIGDEALLIAGRTGLPTAVGRRRADALSALRAGADCNVVLSDDGLQHEGLIRDIEIAVFDERGVGNGRCLPAGPLREPLSGVQCLDALVLNGQGSVAPMHHPQTFRFDVRPTAFIGVGDNRCWELDAFVAQSRGMRIAALAGVGSPQRVFDTLHRLGLAFQPYPLPDHADITADWLAGLPSDWIVMTEKDAVKCIEFDPALRARCVALRVDAHPEAALIDWLEGRLRG